MKSIYIPGANAGVNAGNKKNYFQEEDFSKRIILAKIDCTALFLLVKELWWQGRVLITANALQKPDNQRVFSPGYTGPISYFECH
jgi:hypothetical protein